ncbi:MAG TPA: DNA polymerase III subunit beta [Nitrospirales bacterium]|nr:DNA polymerase III subunit beta [Nitrospirales bacterium]
MKIVIPKSDLLDAVNKVKTVVSAKSALPILSHILFETGGSSIRLSATDLKVSIECTVDCGVEKEGSLTVSSQRIFSILSELPESDITLELEESNVVRLECGKIHTKLYSMSPEEFPPVRNFDGIEPLILPQKLLANIFQRTSFAICTDQARYNLTGLLIEIKNGTLTAVATDGRRMSLVKQSEGIVDGIDIKVIIPNKMIHELERLLDDEGDVEILISENQAGFSFGSLRLVTALIEGTFPNYEMVVPKSHDKEAIVSTAVFIEAIRRTRTMTNDKFNSVRFQINEGTMKLLVSTPEVGEYEEDLPLEYSGEELEIAFNPDFVLDVLKRIATEKSKLVLKDSMSPGVIQPTSSESDGEGSEYVNVVMPIRI